MTSPAQRDTLTAAEKALLQQVRQAIHHRLPDADVYLYGSSARGSRKPDSDYDILVLTDTELDWREQTLVREKVFDIEIERGPVICLLFKSKEDWNSPFSRVSPFHKEVERDKVAL